MRCFVVYRRALNNDSASSFLDCVLISSTTDRISIGESLQKAPVPSI
ncbi:unnamed protein product [Brugia timori]|uniref:Uncharacterized protein n=1 Tax=Brugia timori TaxID=42155 RepID=A0A3P7V4U3_9BILA|nr:unnamed protein product [Brugia timori]